MAKKRVSLQDVADRVNFSKTTVSSVLNANDRISVSAETKELILKTAAEMGYSINYHAQVMNTGVARMIGHGPLAGYKHEWQDERANFFVARMADDMHLGVFQVCADNRYGYQIIHYEEEYANDSSIGHSLQYLEENRIDALIFPTFPERVAHKILKQSAQKPVVTYFWGQAPADYPLPYVALDNTAAIGDVFKHLKKQGHQKVCMLSIRHDPEEPGGRELECENIVSGTGIELDRRILKPVNPYRKKSVMKDYTFFTGYEIDQLSEQLRHILDEQPIDATAVFAHCDSAAIALMRVFQERGIRIPDDVALVGFDNIHAEMQPIPLASVDQNFYLVGRTLAQHAYDLIQLGTQWQSHISEFQTVIPSTFIARKSSH